MCLNNEINLLGFKGWHVFYGLCGSSVALLRDCSVFEKNIIMLSYSIHSNIIVRFCSVQTDRAAMLDEIVDYVKFLRLQVKVKMLLCSLWILL